MSFISRLKSIGLGVVKGAAVVGKETIVVDSLLPIVEAFAPQTPKVRAVEAVVEVTLSQIQNIVATTEAFGALAETPGDKKFAAAMGMFAQLMAASGQILHKDVQDPELLKKALAGYVQATVDFENAFKSKG